MGFAGEVAGMEIAMHYVISDIHGDLDKFYRIRDVIRFQDEDVMYVLGDVLDRAPFGLDILLDIMYTSNIRFVLGNHEKMFMDYFDVCMQGIEKGMIDRDLPVLWQMSYSNEFVSELWMSNGGRMTVENSRRYSLNQLKNIYNFLKKCPLKEEIELEGKKFLLVHGKPSEIDDEDCMLWGQVEPSDTFFGDQIVVFGHTPTAHYQDDTPMRIWKGKQKIGVDCGCGWQKSGGRLGCVCLETMDEFYVNVDETKK